MYLQNVERVAVNINVVCSVGFHCRCGQDAVFSTSSRGCAVFSPTAAIPSRRYHKLLGFYKSTGVDPLHQTLLSLVFTMQKAQTLALRCATEIVLLFSPGTPI